MAIYQLNKILADVRTTLDENQTANSLTLLQDTETLALDQLIQSKIVGAVQLVHMTAPLFLLDPGKNIEKNLYWVSGETYGYIILPEDFMRLIIFKMDDWERPVYEAINETDPRVAKMHSRFAGIRGTHQKPMCVLTMNSIGRTLEFYSCKSDKAKISQAVYIPYPKIEEIDSQKGINICKRCYESVIYAICSMVCASLADIDRSKMYNEMSQALLS